MNKAILVFLALLAPLAAAQDGAVKVAGEELAALLSGAKVTHVSRYGSIRYWTNQPDGSLVASTDNKNYGGATGTKGSSARGTWSINGDGKYCVQIDWRREAENWCAAIVKAADGAYYLNSVDPAKKIEFSR